MLKFKSSSLQGYGNVVHQNKFAFIFLNILQHSLYLYNYIPVEISVVLFSLEIKSKSFEFVIIADATLLYLNLNCLIIFDCLSPT